MTRRIILSYVAIAIFIVIVAMTRGVSTALFMGVTASIYALLALGLNIQFGFGGLFNLAIMGLLMIGGAAVSTISMPVNDAFWASEGPMMLLRALGAAAAGVVLVVAVHQSWRIGVPKRVLPWLKLLAWLAGYIFYRTQIDPAAKYIETEAGWVGGLGLPIWVGYIVAGVLAGLAAWIIGKISLGLRSDYLAIATIGMSEIIRAFVKNMDWLTRGTLTVTPVPWPVPLPGEYQDQGVERVSSFVFGQGAFFLVTLAILALAVFLVERAYGGPWGRMIRAVRDNYIAADSMGKDVKARQVEVFVFGSVLMGIGGALLASYNQLFDPASYIPITTTFLVWVMVIVGGTGNSYGAVLGGFLIYLTWAISEPVSAAIFNQISNATSAMGIGEIPELEARAAQMRVFVLGLVIWLSLRFAPRGLLPEVIRRHV